MAETKELWLDIEGKPDESGDPNHRRVFYEWQRMDGTTARISHTIHDAVMGGADTSFKAELQAAQPQLFYIGADQHGNQWVGKGNTAIPPVSQNHRGVNSAFTRTFQERTAGDTGNKV